jgi:hypothetical protein
MKINLITHDNGVGLTQDVAVMKEVLKEHDCTFVEISTAREVPRADVNVFFELLKPSLYRYAKINTYFPNPEWFWFGKDLKGIDVVFAKTRDSEVIFRTLGCNVLYTSFTSRDLLDHKFINRKERTYLHLSGQSETKGTDATFHCWYDNPDLPMLFFCKTKGNEKYLRTKDRPNIAGCYNRLDEKRLNILINKCAFHVCCSEYEGFGHYLWEAKSAGGIVITTDGAPMKDFVTDLDGFRVKVLHRKRQHYGTLCVIDRMDLARVIKQTMQLTDKQVRDMSLQSRLAWEENDSYFRDIIQQTFNHFNT